MLLPSTPVLSLNKNERDFSPFQAWNRVWILSSNIGLRREIHWILGRGSISMPQMEDFIACFAYVRDLRQENALHNLHEIPDDRTMLYAAQREDCSDIAFGRAKEPFLRQFLTLKHGIPSHDTFSRGSKGSMKGKHKQAGWNDAFLIRLLASFGNAQMRWL